MDFSFPRFDSAGAGDFAVLMVGISARQAASPCARSQAALTHRVRAAEVLAPRGGAFSPAMAASLRGADDR